MTLGGVVHQRPDELSRGRNNILTNENVQTACSCTWLVGEENMVWRMVDDDGILFGISL